MNYTNGFILTCLSTLLLACTPTTQDDVVQSDSALGSPAQPESTGETQQAPPAPVTSTVQLNAVVKERMASGETVGGLELRLIDAPLQADAVNVTLCEVQVQATGQDSWLTVTDDCLSVDLLTLQGGLFESLGLAALPVGEYGQIRLQLTESSVVVDGQSFNLDIPSSARSGLKLIGGFEVREGEVTTLTIDFDANKSVHRTGQGEYKMRPVIFLADATHQVIPEVEPDVVEEPDESEDNQTDPPADDSACQASRAITETDFGWERSADGGESWTPVTLPDTNFGCTDCTRLYRTVVEGSVCSLSFRFASDNAARMWVNGEAVFDEEFNPTYDWCTTAVCCSQCCDTKSNCDAIIAAQTPYDLAAAGVAAFVPGTNELLWEVRQDSGGSGFTTEMTIVR